MPTDFEFPPHESKIPSSCNFWQEIYEMKEILANLAPVKIYYLHKISFKAIYAYDMYVLSSFFKLPRYFTPI